MRLLFDFKKIKGVFNYKGRIRLRFKIGDALTISSELASYNNDNYAFLEKQTLKMDKIGGQLYVQISIVAESGVMLAQITVFFAKLKDLDKIEIKNNNEVYQVYFSLMEIADEEDDVVPGLLNRKSTMVDDNQKVEEKGGKLQILRLGILMFEFAQRLDPLISLYHLSLELFSWKNPYKTIAMGILLTLVIYNLKTSILIVGILLYFGKNFLFKRIHKLSKYKNIHKRLIVPQENAFFLQNSMDNYCLAYQKISQFLFSDDKTMLINIINLLCKMGTFLIVLLFFFGVEHLIVIGLWTLLFLSSPYRTRILKYTQPFMEFVAGEYSKVVDKISSGIFNVLGSTEALSNQEIQKQFYFYKYERWWVLKGWADEKRKFSDEEYECLIAPKEEAPEGWAWVEQWKIDFSGEVDSDGYQYCNDIKTEFNSNSSLATRRRRRWKRVCSKLREEVI